MPLHHAEHFQEVGTSRLPVGSSIYIHLPPLCSEARPLDLPALGPKNYARVISANHLYAFTTLTALILFLRQTIISIENPSCSYFWLVMLLFCDSSQAYAHGGTREPWQLNKRPRTQQSKHALALTAACQERGTNFPTSAFTPQGTLAERSAPIKHGLRALPPLVSEYALITNHPPNYHLLKKLTKMPAFVEKRESKSYMLKKVRPQDPKLTEVTLS